MLPRFRKFERSTADLISDGSPKGRDGLVSDLLRKKQGDWQIRQDASYAVDLIGASVAVGDISYAKDAVESLGRDVLGMSQWTRELIERITGSEDAGTDDDGELLRHVMRAKIRAQRRRLRSEAVDPIGWVELARLYAGVSLGRKAEDAIDVALHLAGDNRFVLRCASRLLVHLGRPDRAKWVLDKKGRTRKDPWLMAARIAVGSVIQETNAVRLGERMLKDRKFGIAHVSELAAAVATLDLENGHIKRARKLFDMALRKPTENSVAQASWASRKSRIQIRMPEVRVSRQFEADTWLAHLDGEWDKCVKSATMWQADEPFSSRPGVLGSFTAAVCLDDYAAGEHVAGQGLIANQGNFALLNNRAYCLIHLGRMREAAEVLQRMKKVETENTEMVYMATYGLYQYRNGREEEGKAWYRQALERADRKRSTSDAALMATQYAMEEAMSNPAGAEGAQREASRRLRAARAEVPEKVFSHLEQKLRDGVEAGRKAKPVKSRL